MKRIDLNKNWILKNERIGEITATVPGCVHTDLIANGNIKDIFWRDNNKNYQWIEDCDWDYECSFDAEAADGAVLVFEGLDTYADIYLNGTHIGSAEDMFIPYRFDVSSVLKAKNNTLRVHFRSPIKEIEGLPLCKGAFTRERIRTRRMQCTYGWDWVDRFVTCGIFRPVYLEYSNGIDIDGLYIYTENVDSFSAQICAELFFKNYENGSVARVEIFDNDGKLVEYSDVYVDREKMVRRFDIAEPELWYPNGYGEQPLYTIKVTVGENTHVESFGIRTLKIMQLRDVEGDEYYKRAEDVLQTASGKKYATESDHAGFQVVVNGVKIFCKGGNWVPSEPFPSDESDEKIRNLVTMAKDMGANFLRVWGGGLFEKKAFYDQCDRCGILVAQDFLMACGEYPEGEQWFIDLLAKESDYATKFLRNHPCLAWYHGDNENATRGSDDAANFTGRRSYLNGIAPQVYKNDHRRQILASSPFGGHTYGSITRGTSHTTNFLRMIFDYFCDTDCSDYKEYMEQFVSRFISEEGVLGAISRPSMLKFMTEQDLLCDADEEMLAYHTKTNPGMATHIFTCIRNFAEKALGGFADGEDKFFKYKYIQYEWTRVSFENVRRSLGYCNGLIFWMYNDCWPAALGWSFVDYYMLPKQAYYSFKRGAKHIIGSVIPKNEGYELVISTDNNSHTDVTVKAYCLKNGKVTDVYTASVKTAGYGTVSLDIPFGYDKDALVVCDIEYSGGADRCFYNNGILNLRACDDLIKITPTENGIEIKALGYVHAVEIEGEFTLDDNCFSMMEGETRTLDIPNAESGNFTVKAYTLER